MPRGPFQGTFSPNVRPTVVTAPDALVYINGGTDIQGCPTCKKKFNVNQYVTSIQVDLSVEGAPGSATISLNIPRHALDDFYFEGNPLITPMTTIKTITPIAIPTIEINAVIEIIFSFLPARKYLWLSHNSENILNFILFWFL